VRRPLGRERRGDTPFCSDECRREQIEMDRVRHRRKKQHALLAAQQAAAAAVMAQREHRPQRQLQPQH
jgi:predicted nucleic acid-binding Zn ribbon protein